MVSRIRTIAGKGSKGMKEKVVTLEYTINLHKRLHGCTFKKNATKAIKEIRNFAQKAKGTTNESGSEAQQAHLEPRNLQRSKESVSTYCQKKKRRGKKNSTLSSLSPRLPKDLRDSGQWSLTRRKIEFLLS
ncbi:hypothetical protein Dsin_011000 [Dipteronia sinensis]|uniref:60S ribosomal protein L31 n=1 Tax=Dipteronia sinensis TaxID=43782 RepID=A0AAE0EEX9_9ROSI|nr:hypothetical protein Dsin_011000 [Dipteronia sinensis]